MDTLTGFSEAPDASQNEEKPADYALPQPHTSVGPLTFCRISSYPHPTLFFIVPVRQKIKVIIPILQVKKARLGEVKCWLGQGHSESYPIDEYVSIPLTLDPRFSAPCGKEQVFPHLHVCGGLCPPRGTPTDWSPHSSCLFLLGLTMCLFLVLLGQTLLSTALNHRDFSGFNSQKVKRDGLSTIAMLKHSAHTQQV